MKVYVWTVPTRVFHALLVLFTLIAFITAEWDELLTLHAAFGAAIGVLMFYRVVWGLIGPKYSRFSDFNLTIAALKEYLFSLFNPKKKYVGHNPAASFAMVGIIVVVLLLTVTGLLTYGIQENRGIFAFLHNSFFREMEFFEELHEFLGTLLWFLIGAHVGGGLFDRLIHAREGTLTSILDGHKNMEGESAKLNLFQKAAALIGIGLSLFVLVYALSAKENIVTAGYNQAVDYKQENPLFVSECGACHTLYPPSLLPKRSWELVMADLGNHFGDDASLEQADQQSILAYLLRNSAESSTSEASLKIVQSMPNQAMIAVTQTPFWKKTHHEIDQAYFESDKVRSSANCRACHSDIEKGLLEDRNIKLPDIRS
ncbi:MAG: cytochrome b/b6 domain-containing protein [Thiovulaceae bacterium]|nr:cytochrome b/b6 domain-containing protein [Sulfurimonadaceae bacterium]